jgi:hypothetical protein
MFGALRSPCLFAGKRLGQNHQPVMLGKKTIWACLKSGIPLKSLNSNENDDKPSRFGGFSPNNFQANPFPTTFWSPKFNHMALCENRVPHDIHWFMPTAARLSSRQDERLGTGDSVGGW